MADWNQAEEVPDLSEPTESVWGPQATPEDPGATVWDDGKPKGARRMPQLGRNRRKGNTKVGDEEGARAQALSSATGRLMEPNEGWRDELAGGERNKAVSSLANGELTHNSGSGFGLA